MDPLGALWIPDRWAFAKTPPMTVLCFVKGHFKILDSFGCCFFLVLSGNMPPYNLCFGGPSYIPTVTLSKSVPFSMSESFDYFKTKL